MSPRVDNKHRQLLNDLPRLLKGLGNVHATAPSSHQYYAIILCDLDDKKEINFRHELEEILETCKPKPNTYFYFAIEEMEAWLLGDPDAILQAYPDAQIRVLDTYVQDSICGTWEVLADAIYVGSSSKLKCNLYSFIGKMKCEWAKQIASYMNVENNRSPSFMKFREELRSLL